MSQPPYQPTPFAPAGPYAPAGAAPYPPAGPAPAAPQQAAPQPAARLPQGALASGFPNYRPPAPSPANRTSLYVGLLVCLLTIAFAVLGFLVVG